MDLKIKNNWFSVRGSSTVTDMADRPVCLVQGALLSFSRQKTVMDLQGNVCYTVRNRILTFIHRHAMIYDASNRQVASIRTKFLTLNDELDDESIHGPIQIIGNILGYDYHIYEGGREIGHIARRLSLRDSFVLHLEDGKDYLFYVALVIALDNISDQRSSDSGS